MSGENSNSVKTSIISYSTLHDFLYSAIDSPFILGRNFSVVYKYKDYLFRYSILGEGRHILINVVKSENVSGKFLEFSPITGEIRYTDSVREDPRKFYFYIVRAKFPEEIEKALDSLS